MAKVVRRRNNNRRVGLTSPSDSSFTEHEQKLILELQQEVQRLRSLEDSLKKIEIYDDSLVRSEIEKLKTSVNRYIRNLKALGFKP